ncbi:MAG: beta-ketoacyl synthase N-terminal-like domain-containing protein, partial [Waddliaceae bacterium]
AYELIQELSTKKDRTQKNHSYPPIAVIGYSCRMPGSQNITNFWQKLVSGTNLITSLPKKRKDHLIAFLKQSSLDYDPEDLEKWKEGFLTEVDTFDAKYFGISTAEANLMDPAHRLFLEVSEETIQSAGYSRDQLSGSRIGVFSGQSGSNYSHVLSECTPLSVTGNHPSFLPARISYLYDFKGPAYSVQSTCASSLLAVNLACRSLQQQECEMALVGGANIDVYPPLFFQDQAAATGIMSPKGICRPFDASADGMGRGEAVIAFMLKPLSTAEKDGDRIMAVILGSAVNNDGHSAAISAPCPKAQGDVIQAALAMSQVNPKDLDYIECHGTATKLGDPIEIQGITNALAPYQLPRQFCGIGSIKGNMGHALDGGAGISSLLKVILSLEHEMLPPSIHINELNPEIDFLRSPVYPVIHSTPWKRSEKRRIAGVSCFSFNGTNVHMIVSDSPEKHELHPYPNPKWKNRLSYWISPDSTKSWSFPKKKNEKPIGVKQIWESILGPNSAKSEKNFFALGGDSLALMQLIAECQTQLNIEIKAAEFLESPSFENLNQMIISQKQSVKEEVKC